MVALDHGDRAAGPQQAAQRRQRLHGLGQVLEHEAHEHVVERPGCEGQVEDVRLLERHVGKPAAATRACAAARESGDTSIDVKRAAGLRAASVTVCAPTPQPASSTVAPGG